MRIRSRLFSNNVDRRWLWLPSDSDQWWQIVGARHYWISFADISTMQTNYPEIAIDSRRETQSWRFGNPTRPIIGSKVVRMVCACFVQDQHWDMWHTCRKPTWIQNLRSRSPNISPPKDSSQVIDAIGERTARLKISDLFRLVHLIATNPTSTSIINCNLLNEGEWSSQSWKTRTEAGKSFSSPLKTIQKCWGGSIWAFCPFLSNMCFSVSLYQGI
jgi:hypothetical protein